MGLIVYDVPSVIDIVIIIIVIMNVIIYSSVPL